MDTQVTELLGRNRLIDELLLAGLEVAIPERDRGVDLIAYVDLASVARKFIAVPIQMKAATTCAFSVDSRYERISNLILAFVWGLRAPEHANTYAMTYPEALTIANEMGWTNTASWKRGRYSTSNPSEKLRHLLIPFKMSPKAWRNKIAQVSGEKLRSNA